MRNGLAVLRRRWLPAALIGSVAVMCAGVLALRAIYLGDWTYTITYKVTGSSSQADITYFPGVNLLAPLRRASGPRQLQVQLPWQETVTSDHLVNRRWAAISARGGPADVLTCQVWINGQLAETRSAGELVRCGYDEERNPVP